MTKRFTPSFADRIVDTPLDLARKFNLVEAQNLLAIPWAHLLGAEKPNHVVAPHPATATMLGDEAQSNSLPRFSVDPAVAEIISSMISDEETMIVADDMARAIPAARGWVEWQRANVPAHMGISWQADQSLVTARFYIQPLSQSARTAPGLIGEFCRPVGGGSWEKCHLRICNADYIGDPANAQGLIHSAARFLTCFSAFISLPHAVDAKIVAAPDALQKSRHKRGRPFPLLSMNVVKFHPLQHDAVRSDKSKMMSTSMVRLHHVIGHWRRIIREGRQTLTHVQSHWRGNARSGIILKNREVRI